MKQLSVIGLVSTWMCLSVACMATEASADDDMTAEQAEGVDQPASVVASGSQCFVDFSIDHRVNVGAVGPAVLVPRAQSTATPSLFGPAPTIISIDHVDSVSVTPSSAATNQVPVANTVTTTQTSTAYGTPVMASVTWNDVAQFLADNLCTASATTTITVHYASSPPCSIVKTTFFSKCAPVR